MSSNTRSFSTTVAVTPAAAPLSLSPLSSSPVSDYAKAAVSDNTRQAYQSDIADFLKNGGKLPALPEQLVDYLNQQAPHYNPRTLSRRLTALRHWHRHQNHPDPTQHPAVIAMLRGVKRLHGRPRVQAAALQLEELDQLVAYLKENPSIKHDRDTALVLVGFFGAFRRSELVSLRWEQVQFLRDGLKILLPRSKTDQTGEGQTVTIPIGNLARCPLRALLTWKEQSQRDTGPIFCAITKQGKLRDQAMCPNSFNRLFKALVRAAGLSQPERFSAHSTRRGFATESARKGASLPAIQRHGRWQCHPVLEYIEAGREFSDSAANVLFDFHR